MPKNKRPVPRPSSQAPQEDRERLAQTLAELALDLAEQAADEEQAGQAVDRAALSLKEDAFNKLLRNALRKHNDELLYGAIEHAREADVAAYELLRERVAEASATMLLRREGAPSMEINAFAVPLFVRSAGGLRQEQCFQDPAAFEELVASIVSAGLESGQAKVVLISHAYDLDEFDRITYSTLAEMVREAAASMTEKKLVPTPALEASMGGWRASAFGPEDEALELRFLLGFAMKRSDDKFYQVPAEEAAADAYFEARMARFRNWTVLAAPLVKRCLAAQPESVHLDFLYQDLPFGAKEQALAELAMLQMMADVAGALARGGVAPAQVRAVAGPADVDDEMVLRVNVYGPGDALLASSDKPLDLAADLQTEVDDICDALATLGIAQVAVALRFAPDGTALEVRAYQGAALSD